MNHTPVIVTVNDIINRSEMHTCTPWYDLLAVEMPKHARAIKAENYDKAADIEAAWLQEHAEDKVEVSWPEHVIYPQYNGDANYRFVD